MQFGEFAAHGGFVVRQARLHLDENQRAAPAGHDVDLAHGTAPAPRHDAIALGDQQRGSAALGREAKRECDLPLRARRGR